MVLLQCRDTAIVADRGPLGQATDRFLVRAMSERLGSDA
jgi:hypothetical protein